MKRRGAWGGMMAVWLGIATGAGLAQETPRSGPSWDTSRGPLKVSGNGRFLVHEDGTPFFYLGDTAWELFHRLNREEAERYLENRRGKGFTVIQAVCLAELDGLNTPNPYGDRPLADNNPATPATTPGADPGDPAQYDYWDHVDYIVERAAAKGMYIGMLPTWGSHVVSGVLNAGNAEAYGRFLGRRYAGKPVLWILGGDRNASGYEAVWRALARGLAIGVSGSEDYSKVMMTFHPPGGNSSATWFHADVWLDFNMLQTGHCYNDSYGMIVREYGRTPTKPVMDGEPMYEDHPVCFNPDNGYATDVDVRRYAYWNLFAGAHGHTYGCHNIWQMYAPGRNPVSWARRYWYDSLDLPGAWDMMHLRNLMLSRPFLSRVPDQSIVTEAFTGTDHLRATRGDGYAFVYTPTGRGFTVNLGKISGTTVRAYWWNPRDGTSTRIGDFPNSGTRAFTPPSSGAGNDWVLVLDDASRGFHPPGSGATVSLPPPPAAGFVKGINFNGRAVTIEGNTWSSYEAALSSGLFVPSGTNLATTSITPDPPADPDTTAMLNTALWSTASFRFSQAVGAGTYEVTFWVMENYQSNARAFDVRLEGSTVASAVGTMALGNWRKYGPYRVSVVDGALDVELVRLFGDPHVMGMAIVATGEGTPGVLLREWWTGLSGTAVGDLTGSAAYAGPPTGSDYVVRFETPEDWGDEYGQRVRGYLVPPATGDYYFWIASDDNGELWISLDDRPVNKYLIARVPGWTGAREWSKYPEQTSRAVRLEAGRRYYVEALHKEGFGGDHLSVGWQLPDGTLERPIPGNRLVSPEAAIDSDGDGVSDAAELAAGTNPNDAASAPAGVRRGRSGDSGGCGTTGVEAVLLLMVARFLRRRAPASRAGRAGRSSPTRR